MNARHIALKALLRVEKSGAYSNLVLQGLCNRAAERDEVKPEDNRLQSEARLFGAWRTLVTDSVIRSPFVNLTVPAKVELLRQFETGDSLQRAFSERYLRPRLFTDGSLQSDSIEALSKADRALLVYAGLSSSLPVNRQARFTDPAIDFIDSRIVPLGQGWYRVELYYLPLAQPAVDYTIAGRVSAPALSVADEAGQLQFDFDPHLPTSGWAADEVMMTTKRIYYAGEISGVKTGLYDRAVNPTVFVPVEGTDQNMIDLKVPEAVEN